MGYNKKIEINQVYCHNKKGGIYYEYNKIFRKI